MIVILPNSDRGISVGPTIGAGGYGVTNEGPTEQYLFKFGEIDFTKVGHMIPNRVIPTQPGYEYAWPEAICVDPHSGKPCAYAMRRVINGLPTEALFTKVNVPEVFRVRVALNHVRSLLDLEASGYRRGDLPNSHIRQDASIAEFDMDSVQINHKDATFNGGDAKALTAAPEVLEHFDAGGDRGFETTREHDAWAIASLVWLLLMRGEHPFDAVWLGKGDRPDLPARVKAGLWPHDPSCSEVAPRPGARPFGSLSGELQSLFERTFVDGHPNRDPASRPTLAEWERALTRIDRGAP